jgi:ubiquinone/menaquinone biosynthesis C-methylase UbiE
MNQPPHTSPFQSAAAYYDRFRSPYPPEAFGHIRAAFDLGAGTRVLDLGCGPGTVAIALSGAVAEVVAVDPEERMLAQGERLARARGARNIRWVHARAEDFQLEGGRFKAVTMGQSFHWMDRDAVLGRLADFIEDEGGLALINPGRRRPQESWEDVAGAVVTKYLGRRRRHPKAHPQAEHEPALRRSAHFSVFTTREFPSEIERDIPSIVGCLYSTTMAAKPLFGDRAGAFERDLSEALLRFNPSGVFKERLETEVLIAPKG